MAEKKRTGRIVRMQRPKGKRIKPKVMKAMPKMLARKEWTCPGDCKRLTVSIPVVVPRDLVVII
jgi:hypothetical protein